MSALADLLAPEDVIGDLPVPHRRALFAAVGAHVAAWGLDPRLVADGLAERERLGTTGFGGGIALPHTRVASLPAVRAVLVRLPRPIDFDAVDGLPVDLAVVLVSPEDAGVDHLRALARVSRRLRERSLPDKLRGAGSSDALYALAVGIGAHDGG